MTALTDNSGTVAERYHYTPYGQMTVLDANFAVDLDGLSDVINPTMFAGRRLDTESGLLYFRNRHSHSPLGNFISRDKILYNGDSMSLFEYVKSDPCSHLDPYGNAILPEGHTRRGPQCAALLQEKRCNGTYMKINHACKLGPFNQPVTPGVCCALLLNKRNQFYDSSPSYFDVPIFCDPWVAKSSVVNFCGGNSTICQDDLDSYLDALVGGNPKYNNNALCWTVLLLIWSTNSWYGCMPSGVLWCGNSISVSIVFGFGDVVCFSRFL